MKSDVLSILELFGTNRRYLVPMFQRQYVWTLERQWEPLWEDIEREAIDLLCWQEMGSPPQAEPQEHFLGAIVLDQNKFFGLQVPTNLIIDGQQRMTTCQVLLCAFRDVTRRLDLQKFSDAIRSHTLNTGLMQDEETEKYKVLPTHYDEPHFKAIVEATSFEDVQEL